MTRPVLRQRTVLRGRGVAALVVLIGLVLTVAGCGLSADNEPSPIAAEDLPSDLLDPNPPTSTTLLDPGATAAVTVYLVVREGDTTRLTAVPREVSDPTSPGDRIRALLAPPSTQEQEAGLISSIPSDTVLLDISRPDPGSDELLVNVSGALFDVQGKELANAFAQIVWTVTEIPGVRQVRFRVDGQSQRAINDEGVEQPGAVTRSDYSALAPTR